MSGRWGLPAALLAVSLPVGACWVAASPQPQPQPAQVVVSQPVAPPPGPLTAPPVATTPVRVVQGPGYVFSVPAHWEPVQVGPPALVSVRDTTVVGGFLTNVNLVSEPFLGDGPGYAAANIPLLQTAAVIVAQRPAVVGSLASTELESIWTRANPPYRTLQRFAAGNGRGWVITCSGAHATFESVRALCTSILDTFRVN